MVKNQSTTQETQVRSLAQEDSLEKEMATHSNNLLRKFHGQSSLEGYSQWGHKELDTTEQHTHTHTQSVQSCPTLSDPMDCSTPGFPVHHQLPELVQTHLH